MEPELHPDVYKRQGLHYSFMPRSIKPMLTFVIESDLLKRLDDFRFKHRFVSRAAAIKWLLIWALDQKAKPPAPG